MDNNINNWYEHKVFEKLIEFSLQYSSLDEEQWSDIACVALNHLPPRYVRHTVDMNFYTSPQEAEEMEGRINTAIKNAIEFVRQHPMTEPPPNDRAVPGAHLNPGPDSI